MPYFFAESPVGFMLPILAMILAFYAQNKVNSTFNKYSRFSNRRGYTGRDVAEMMLRRAGLFDVRIEPIRGNLTDHYDPRAKVLRLSEPVYKSSSLSAIGVAAHECGHAIQHNEGYMFLIVRNAIVPAVNLSSQAAMPLFMLGMILGFGSGTSLGWLFIQLGILLFTIVVAFQVITLPVEFNASNRAIHILLAEGYLDEGEIKSAKKVLNAAAMTYVAAAAVALANLVRLLLMARRRND